MLRAFVRVELQSLRHYTGIIRPTFSQMNSGTTGMIVCGRYWGPSGEASKNVDYRK
jgi:hypothetical protein